jgi:hypothetical protein
MATKLPPSGKASAIDPAARAQGPAAVTPAAEVSRVAQTAAAEQVTATAEAAPVGATAAVGRAASADRIANIADRLRRGLLTPNQAVEELIADTVKHSLPGVAVDSRLGEELRSLLNAYVQEDPQLAAKIGRLGVDT